MDIHEIDKKSDKPVVDVPQGKYPAKCIPENLDNLGEIPPLPTVDISQEIVERVATTIGGAVCPVDGSQLQLWLK